MPAHPEAALLQRGRVIHHRSDVLRHVGPLHDELGEYLLPDELAELSHGDLVIVILLCLSSTNPGSNFQLFDHAQLPAALRVGPVGVFTGQISSTIVKLLFSVKD